VSCRRHQIEHQKCPEDCPRRRPVVHQEPALKEESAACPSPLHHSNQLRPSAYPVANLNNLNREDESRCTLPSISQHLPNPARASHLPVEHSNDFQFYHNLIWKSPADNGTLGPDFHWFRPRDNLTVSNSGIVLDLQDSGPPHVADRIRDRRNSSSGTYYLYNLILALPLEYRFLRFSYFRGFRVFRCFFFPPSPASLSNSPTAH
jgi:hypothetical protein